MLFYVFVLFMCPLDPLHSGYVLTFGLCWVYPLNVTNIWTTFVPMISMFYHPLLFNGISSTMCDKTCLAAYYCSQIAIRLFHMDNYFTPGRSMYKNTIYLIIYSAKIQSYPSYTTDSTGATRWCPHSYTSVQRPK